MCIVFIATTHPKYRLILIDNRDEFVLRPTSRPYWWKCADPLREGHTVDVLSARDLQRPERGTWLGITRSGLVAVLTNFREIASADQPGPALHGRRSRGGMVTAWLGQPPDEGVRSSVARLVADGEGVQGVGGFSMVCGKLRPGKATEEDDDHDGLAILSNRAGSLDDVPIVKSQHRGVWGLTNTAHDKSHEWPKISNGLGPFEDIVRAHGEAGDAVDEDDLIQRLLDFLTTDTLEGCEGKTLEDNVHDLKNSIFIPPLGAEKQHREMEEARAAGGGAARGTFLAHDMPTPERPDDEEPGMFFDKGLYGTQRQTVILVDYEGNVTFVERALWDAHGHRLEKGEGDVTFRFKIEKEEEK
ncbi:Pfam:DUF833 [Geosmithia morbida]|uniref:Pfam:DUF833 n=1 Tax=Geosmithia morbida TaxID=1094350 RepID=A0A9P4YUH0_9HYPO|nr:Pfam:DUF833 [Geosmithia morbida]KAF4122772.1 Pfam:DUF833 [Geosmithia morbida]